MSSARPAPPVDESVYSIGEEEKEFLKQATGIDDDEELKKHVCDIQAQAYCVFPYPCIRAFRFLNFQLCHQTVYKEIIKIGRERPDALFLEIGCAFGTDIRKLVADGYPLDNVLASDIENGYFDLGHKLFKTTSETYPFAFIPGDIFELASELAENPVPTHKTGSLPPLHLLTSLTPLCGRISVLYASSVFHLFPPDKQQKLAHIFANLLSPLSGSLIVGKQAATKSGIYELNFGNEIGHAWMYSISAWKDLWMGPNGPFKPEDVDAQVSEQVLSADIASAMIGKPTTLSPKFLWWSIRRV